MGTYGLKGVIQAWDLGKLTTEQAVGQMLLLLEQFYERLAALEGKSEQNRRHLKELQRGKKKEK